jgi:hypothetical protein
MSVEVDILVDGTSLGLVDSAWHVVEGWEARIETSVRWLAWRRDWIEADRRDVSDSSIAERS